VHCSNFICVFSEKKQKIEPPSFLKKIGDCEVLSGMSAKFTACVNGFPEPEFEWFLNGKKLEPSDRIAMEADNSGLLRLIIKDTQPEDVGIYRCRIFNPHGEASCEAELRYDCKNNIRLQNNSYNARYLHKPRFFNSPWLLLSHFKVTVS